MLCVLLAVANEGKGKMNPVDKQCVSEVTSEIIGDGSLDKFLGPGALRRIAGMAGVARMGSDEATIRQMREVFVETAVSALLFSERLMKAKGVVTLDLGTLSSAISRALPERISARVTPRSRKRTGVPRDTVEAKSE